MLSNRLKKSLEALLEKNDKDLSEGLRVYKLETQLGKKKKKCFKEEKLRVLIVKVTSLGIISPASLALKLAQDSYQSDVRGLDGGCQGVWRVSTRRSGHILSPLGGSQRVTHR